MTYREALLFIGKSLTLGCYPDRIRDIQSTIGSGSLDWEQIVQISTGQFVFPTLYLQLKRAGLSEDLPEDLVEYMEEFTSLNRERNQQILEQALELTSLLNQNGIEPTFLKGVGHLLDGLYEDIEERMVGDIDLLVQEKEMIKAAELLIKAGYTPLPSEEVDITTRMHYPRLTNKNRVAAVEVHRQILPYPYYNSLDSDMILGCAKKLNLKCRGSVLQDRHQILHNILHWRFSHQGYYYAETDLRQGYDLLLLSQREDPLRTIEQYKKFFHGNNANLALNNLLFCQPDCFPYKSTGRVKMFMVRINLNLNHSHLEQTSRIVLHFLWKIGTFLKRLVQSIYDRAERQALLSRLKNPLWYRKHLNTKSKKMDGVQEIFQQQEVPRDNII